MYLVFTVLYTGQKLSTPLHLAAQNGHDETVKCLIRFRANFNAAEVVRELLNQACPGHRPACTWFLEITFMQICMRLCICVCIPPRP